MESQSNESVASDNSETIETFEQQVNHVVSGMKEDEHGNFQFGDNDTELSEEVKVAANSERRRRSSEGALTKTRLELKANKTVVSKLSQQIVGNPVLNLDASEQSRLEDLKYKEPDQWRSEINKLEQSAATTLQETLAGYDTEASQQAILENRQEQLDTFNALHPDALITQELIDLEVPKRITNKLEANKITFEQFLNEVNTYVTKSKKVGDTSKVELKPNLGDAGGDSNPSDEAIIGDLLDTSNYATLIY